MNSVTPLAGAREQPTPRTETQPQEATAGTAFALALAFFARPDPLSASPIAPLPEERDRGGARAPEEPGAWGGDVERTRTAPGRATAASRAESASAIRTPELTPASAGTHGGESATAARAEADTQAQATAPAATASAARPGLPSSGAEATAQIVSVAGTAPGSGCAPRGDGAPDRQTGAEPAVASARRARGARGAQGGRSPASGQGRAEAGERASAAARQRAASAARIAAARPGAMEAEAPPLAGARIALPRGEAGPLVEDGGEHAAAPDTRPGLEDLAARLASARRAVDRATVRFAGENGLQGQIRVALRGQTLHATILSADQETIQRLEHDIGQLHRALEERGFANAQVTVQQVRSGPRADVGPGTHDDSHAQDNAPKREQPRPGDGQRDGSRNAAEEDSGRPPQGRGPER